jgi:hypothetical protein
MEIWTNIAGIWQSKSPNTIAKRINTLYNVDMLTKQQINKNYLEKETRMLRNFGEKTKTRKLFNALYEGQAITPATALHKFGIKNMTAEVSRIRQGGFAVYANRKVAGNGVKTTEYVIGKPSRALVALAYKAQSLGITL